MVVDLLESQQRFKIIGLTIVGCQADTNVLWLDRIGEFIESKEDEIKDAQVFGLDIHPSLADVEYLLTIFAFQHICIKIKLIIVS